MAKKLVRFFLLIPVLIITAFTCPLLAFAEGTTTNIKCNFNSCSFASEQSQYLVSSYNYCSDNTYDLYFSYGQSIKKTLILYNETYDYYVNLFWIRDFSPSNESVYSNLNLKTDVGQYYNNQTDQSLGVQPYVYFLSKTDLSSYLVSDVGYTSTQFKSLNNDDIYFYAKLAGDYTFPTYYSSHLSDFVLVSDSSYPGYYIDGVKQTIENVCITPEPEPEPEPVPDNNTSLDMVFVPNYIEGQCIEVLDKDTLRVFDNENSTNYIDYFVNSHYLSKTGSIDSSYQKNCSNLKFTSIGYYRNDFPDILLIIGSLSVFSIGFIYILFKRFRKR